MLSNIKNIGNLTGCAVFGFIFLFYALREPFKHLKQFCYQFKLSKFFWQLFKTGFCAFLIYGVVITCVIIFFAFYPSEKNATVVVLGAQVKSWGPSSILQKRIDAAYAYLIENPESLCIASGGQGKDEPISEGLSIFQALTLRNNIEKSRILIEDLSTNTRENIKFSMGIIDEINANKNLAIVSDSFHQARARLIARKLGIDSKIGAVNAKTNPLYYPTFLVREWFALPAEVLFRS